MKYGYEFESGPYSLKFGIPSTMLRADLLAYEQYVGHCVLVSEEPMPFKEFDSIGKPQGGENVPTPSLD